MALFICQAASFCLTTVYALVSMSREMKSSSRAPQRVVDLVLIFG